jgi:hypothetical protein
MIRVFVLYVMRCATGSTYWYAETEHARWPTTVQECWLLHIVRVSIIIIIIIIIIRGPKYSDICRPNYCLFFNMFNPLKPNDNYMYPLL